MKHIFAIAVFLSVLLAPPLGAEEAGSMLALEDCRIRAAPGYPGIKARCGTLERPENPADPESTTLELFVAVVPALSLEPEPDPFVPIAGGPGQATTEFYAGYAQAFEDIRRRRDIVLLDQRGTGESAPLDCEVSEDLVEGRFSSEETISETERCLDQLAHDARFFTTSIAVSDLEALRVTLGYPRFNVYGVSYGTRVAQHFARRYPDSTRSIILDGVAAPQIALGPGIAIEAQKALDAIFARCLEDPACAERYPDIQDDFLALKMELAAAPAVLVMPDPVTGRRDTFRFGDAELAGAIRLLSYHPNTVALIPFLVDEAAGGNYEPLASQYLMVAASLSESLSLGMHNAVVCTEDAPFFEGVGISREALEATYIGPMQVDALEAICSVWPAGVLDEGLREPLVTDKPALLLSGAADPITPPGFAELAMVEFRNARHLIGRDQGHGQAGRGCFPRILGEFVSAGSIDGLDTDCIERMFAMPFFLDYSGPSP